MSRIYISAETDPYFNVAAEYQLLKDTAGGTSLFLWRNKPSVIFGRNQNVFAECDEKLLKKYGVLPVRRFSGGGAVFHDLGNVNFTFLSKEQDADTGRYRKVLRDAVSSLGISCTFGGRNDLLAEGKKFSGQAYYAEWGNLLYHGTVMINVDLDLLSAVLKPSFLKLHSKGIDSVRSRVVNLSQIDAGITPESVQEALMIAFAAEYGAERPVSRIDRRSMQPSVYEKIRKDDWIYGESPDFDVRFEKKLSFGNVTVFADISGGKVSRAKIYTDSLAALDFSPCEKSLAGLLFREDALAAAIENFVQNKAGF